MMVLIRNSNTFSMHELECLLSVTCSRNQFVMHAYSTLACTVYFKNASSTWMTEILVCFFNASSLKEMHLQKVNLDLVVVNMPKMHDSLSTSTATTCSSITTTSSTPVSTSTVSYHVTTSTCSLTDGASINLTTTMSLPDNDFPSSGCELASTSSASSTPFSTPASGYAKWNKCISWSQKQRDVK